MWTIFKKFCSIKFYFRYYKKYGFQTIQKDVRGMLICYGFLYIESRIERIIN